MNRIIDLLIRRRRHFLVLTIAAVGFFGFFLKDLAVDNSLAIWFLDDDPHFVRYRNFQEKFGNDDVVTFLVSDRKTLFTRENLTLIRRLSDTLEGLDSVARVISLARVRYIAPGAEDELVIEPLYGADPTTEGDVERIRDRVTSWPALESFLVSADGRSSLVVVKLKVFENIDIIRGAIISDVERAARGVLEDAGESLHMGGIGVIYNAVNNAAIADSGTFQSLSYLMIFICIALFVGSLASVFLALGVLVLSMVLTLGVFSLMGHAINMVTMILPTLIMVIGVADFVHIVSHHLRERRENPDPVGIEAMRTTLGRVLKPCLLTTVTTAAGFASLLSSPMAVIRDFGLYAALGAVVTLVVTVALVVAASARFGAPAPEGKRRIRARLQDGIVKCLATAASLSTRRPMAVIAAALIVIAGSCFGISRLEVNTYPIEYLNEADPTRLSHQVMEDRFGSFVPLEFTLEAAGPGGVKDPIFLRHVADFQTRLVRDPWIDSAFSIADTVMFLNRAFNDGADSAYSIPDDARTVAELLLFYEMDPENDLAEMVDAEFRTARVTAYVRTLSAGEYGELVDRCVGIFEATRFPPELLGGEGLQPDGYVPLYVIMIEYILASQIRSFCIAFVLVFGLIGLAFRSLRITLICVLPNLAPVLLVLGYMGFAQIPLDIGTAMIAAVLLGIVVDDTIHFVSRFRREIDLSPGDANGPVNEAVKGAGPAILATSIILAAGFFILSLASVHSIANFGTLCGLAVLAALAADLLFLPALLKKFYR